MITPKVLSDLHNLVSDKLSQDPDGEITSIVVGLLEKNMIDEINLSRSTEQGIEILSLQGIPIIVDYRADDGTYVLKNNAKFSPAKKVSEDLLSSGKKVSKTFKKKYWGLSEE